MNAFVSGGSATPKRDSRSSPIPGTGSDPDVSKIEMTRNVETEFSVKGEGSLLA